MLELAAEKVQFFTKVIGSVALAKPMVKRMGFAKIIDKFVPCDAQQKVSYGQVVEILVANRLTSPTPLYGVEQWAEDIESKKLYGIAAEELNDDRLGRTLDALAPNLLVLKGAIARDISRRFQIGVKQVHWDLTSFHFTGAYEHQTEEYIQISYTKSRPSDSAFKAVKVGVNVANDGQGPVPIFYEALDGNADPFEATLKNMEHLKAQLKVDRIVRISDKGCFSAKIVAETIKQGCEVIASMKLTESYRALLEEAWQSGQEFVLLAYLSQNQARKKDPSQQDRYYGLEVESSLTYGQKEYPMRLIFVRSDGKLKRAAIEGKSTAPSWKQNLGFSKRKWVCPTTVILKNFKANSKGTAIEGKSTAPSWKQNLVFSKRKWVCPTTVILKNFKANWTRCTSAIRREPFFIQPFRSLKGKPYRWSTTGMKPRLLKPQDGMESIFWAPR